MKTFFVQKYAQKQGEKHVEAKGGKFEPYGEEKEEKSVCGTEEKIYGISHPFCMKWAVDASDKIVKKAPRRTEEEHI